MSRKVNNDTVVSRMRSERERESKALRVMLLVPLDQGTQGNKGRKGISLEAALWCPTNTLAKLYALLWWIRHTETGYYA